MARINDTTTFPIPAPAEDDIFIGSDVSNTTNNSGGETVNFRLGDFALGWGQTWQDVTGSRTHSTSYQNTTGKPIEVSFATSTSATRNVEVSTDNSTWVTVAETSGGTAVRISFIVPPGHYYRINGSVVLTSWAELR